MDLAREALAQTGLAARNAYIFEDNAQAAKELNIVDEQKAIYLATPLRRRIVEDMGVLALAAEKESESAATVVEDYATGAQRLVTALAVVAFVLSVVIAGMIKRVLLKQLRGEPAYAAEIAGWHRHRGAPRHRIDYDCRQRDCCRE